MTAHSCSPVKPAAVRQAETHMTGSSGHENQDEPRDASATPRPVPRAILCPYCGQVSRNHTRCTSCGGQFDHLSRQATQNAMGPWQVRDTEHPFRPGCSFETIRAMVARGKIRPSTILRGPTTRQFWTPAKRTPSVANLLGRCHNCAVAVRPTSLSCPSCGAGFDPEPDRQYLGLMPIRLLPGEATAEVVAASALGEAALPIGAHRPLVAARGSPAAQRHAATRPHAAPTQTRARAIPDQPEALDPNTPTRRGGRGAMLLILAIGATVLVLSAAFVASAPLLGIGLPDWVPTFGTGSDRADQQPVADESDGSTLAQEDASSAPGGASSAIHEEMTDSAVESPLVAPTPTQETPASPEQIASTIAQVRELMAAGDDASLERARTLIESLPGESAVHMLGQALQELARLRSLVGTL
ncbi:MAG: hypothetical protein IID31_04000 [Planctomycetes bacterium]|nr:hypothetical protein [Planctomycetota bacterium]